MQRRPTLCRFVTVGVLLLAVSMGQAAGQQPQFGGEYAGLDARRQRLIDDWVARFVKTTGQQVAPGPFYDDLVTLSAKTTFEAVTHALMTTALTDRFGASLGDVLALVERVESVHGEKPGAPGDRQFRMYVQLTANALGVLARSREFRRGADNSVYHKGYPVSYRGEGAPSIQLSIGLDGRQADVDVDYRSSSFPAALFNGHLTASNSDVRAGDNYDRHLNRWTGFQNWWRGFFGVRQERLAEVSESDKAFTLPHVPRVGNKSIDAMVHDFLTAWLVEGDTVAAMGYVSNRSYACLAQASDNPSAFDRGLAPFQLLVNLKAAHDSLENHASLEGLTAGTRLSRPGVRVVKQPHHARFVIYDVPDDVAAAFDCESRLTIGGPARPQRTYGNYFGATFYVAGNRDVPVTLLWAKDNGYWKIVSWQTGGSDDVAPPPELPAAPAPVKEARITADPTLVQAARDFLESWVVRKDYDAAFGYLSPKVYGCYDLERNRREPASPSPDAAARGLRQSLEAVGKGVGSQKKLDAIIEAADPVHPATRVMNHRYARVFSLSSIPNALADAAECAARAAGTSMPDPLPLEYGSGFGLTIRFRTRGGDAPVLRLLWRKEGSTWRITSFAVEQA